MLKTGKEHLEGLRDGRVVGLASYIISGDRLGHPLPQPADGSAAPEVS